MAAGTDRAVTRCFGFDRLKTVATRFCSSKQNKKPTNGWGQAKRSDTPLENRCDIQYVITDELTSNRDRIIRLYAC